MLTITSVLLLITYILCDPQKIKDFRSNPMGISQKEGLFEVGLNTTYPINARVVAYADVNSDK